MSGPKYDFEPRRRAYHETKSRKNGLMNLNKPSRMSMKRRISSLPPNYSLPRALVSTTDYTIPMNSDELDIDYKGATD